MKSIKRKKGVRKDGTPKKITVPSRRGRSWDSMLEPHYEDIRLARLSKENYEKIAVDLGYAASTIASFVKNRSDGTRPYTLPPRTGSVSTAVAPTCTNKTVSTASIPMPPIEAIMPPANYISPVKSLAAGTTKKVKRFSFPPGTPLTVKTT